MTSDGKGVMVEWTHNTYDGSAEATHGRHDLHVSRREQGDWIWSALLRDRTGEGRDEHSGSRATKEKAMRAAEEAATR